MTEFDNTLFLSPSGWGTGTVCFKVLRYVDYSVVIQIIAPKSKRKYISNMSTGLEPGQACISINGIRRCEVITSIHNFVKNRLIG